MKKHGLRIAIFILSFAFGIGFVAILNFTIFDQAVSENDAIAKTERTDSNHSVSENVSNTVREGTEDIEIKFKEFVEMENGLAVDFIITNYSSDTFVYQAYPKVENLEPIFTLTELKIDGKKIYQMHCGTGLTDFELRAGETKIFRYSAGIFSVYWKNGKSIQIGYHFRKKIAEDYQTFWSKNLPISEIIAEKLLKEQTQR